MVRQGYTLIEIIVVLAIIGVIAVMVFSGIAGYNKNQYLSNAQRELVTALRSAQNRVLNGANGQSLEVFDFASYISKLPPGISVDNPTLKICFANPLSTTISCDICGNHYSCPTGVTTIILSNGSLTKSVAIDGSGIFINRVYAQ